MSTSGFGVVHHNGQHALPLVDCAAKCGTLVRAGVEYCDKCEAMACAMEAKRIFDAHKRRAYDAASERVDVGVMDLPGGQGEDVDLPTMLDNASARERFHVAMTLLGVVTVLGLLAAPWFVGVRDIWLDIFGR